MRGKIDRRLIMAFVVIVVLLIVNLSLNILTLGPDLYHW